MKELRRKYYLALCRLHPMMTAARAIKQARIWVNAGYMDIRFFDYIGGRRVEIV